LVEWAKTQNRPREKGKHAEHHIVPKSFYRSYCEDGWLEGDYDHEDNLVLLTHEEHARCHIFLALRMTEGLAKRKMGAAVRITLEPNSITGIKPKITSRILASVMRTNAESSVDMHSDPEFKKRHGDAVREALSTPEIKEKLVQSITKANENPEVQLRRQQALLVAGNRTEVLAKRRDPTVYHFIHEDGRTFIGARWEFEEFWGYPKKWISPLFRKKVRKVFCGWRLSTTDMAQLLEERRKSLASRSEAMKVIKNTPEAKSRVRNSSRDHSVYHFIHEDGTEFIGERWQLEEQCGYPPDGIGKLFRSKPNKTCRGWRLYEES
jgi:hypothetical protein